MDAEVEDPDLDEVLAAARDEEEEPPGMLLAQAQIAGKLFGTAAPGLGRFRVLSRLGGGGMGVVYSAYDPELDRGVALKTVHVPSASTEIALGEAKALARLSHPNVVPVFDVGVASGHVYIVMELVRGETLRAAIAGKPLREVLDLYRQAGLALAAAHDAGLVHRDFKPENALVGTDGRVRVVDFGLACEATSARTKAGTPRYMPPESEVAPAADQYSFGVALAEALPEPRPAWVQSALDRATAQDPAARFPSMHELLRALSRDPARIRRQRWIAMAVAVALAGVGASAFVIGRGHVAAAATEVCTGAAGEIDAAWAPAAMQSELTRIAGLSAYGKELAPQLASQLAEHRAGWVANHRAACFAHHRGEQSDALFDRRMACLDRSRAGRLAVADLSTAASVESLPGLAKAVRAIPEPSACADLGALLAEVDPPAPTIAFAVADVRRDLQRARVLIAAGDHEHAATVAENAVAKARGLRYLALLSEALLVEGQARMSEDDSALAIARLHEAHTIALSVGALSMGVEAWARMAWLMSRRGWSFEGTAVVSALATRSGAFARALLYNNLGSIALAQGRRSPARAHLEAALAAARDVTGPGALELANIRFNLAISVDENETRRELLRDAEWELARLLGRDHPDALTVAFVRATLVAIPDTELAAVLTDLCARFELHPGMAAGPAECWVELANVREDLHDRAGALDAIGHALAHKQVQPMYLATGYSLLWHGDVVGARSAFEKSLADIPARLDEPWFWTLARAELQIGLARALDASGDRASALRTLNDAIEILAVIARDHPAATIDRRIAQARRTLAEINERR